MNKFEIGKKYRADTNTENTIIEVLARGKSMITFAPVYGNCTIVANKTTAKIRGELTEYILYKPSTLTHSILATAVIEAPKIEPKPALVAQALALLDEHQFGEVSMNNDSIVQIRLALQAAEKMGVA